MDNYIEVFGLVIVFLSSIPCEYIRIKAWTQKHGSTSNAYSISARVTLFSYITEDSVPLDTRKNMRVYLGICLFGAFITVIGFAAAGRILLSALGAFSLIVGIYFAIKLNNSINRRNS